MQAREQLQGISRSNDHRQGRMLQANALHQVHPILFPRHGHIRKNNVDRIRVNDQCDSSVDVRCFQHNSGFFGVSIIKRIDFSLSEIIMLCGNDWSSSEVRLGQLAQMAVYQSLEFARPIPPILHHSESAKVKPDALLSVVAGARNPQELTVLHTSY